MGRGTEEDSIVGRQKPVVQRAAEEHDDGRLAGKRRQSVAVRVDDVERRFGGRGCETKNLMFRSELSMQRIGWKI